MPNNQPIDILLAQKFLPQHGGSIWWMYQVYRRWPHPVQVVTHDYYNAPPCTPEYPLRPQRPPAGDHVTEPNLRMDRRDIFIDDWGLESLRRLRRYWRMTKAVGERFRNGAVSGNGHTKRTKPVVRVHCIHAVPEAVSLLPLRWRYGKRLKIICYAHGEEVTACCSSRQLRFLMHRANAAADLMIANSQYTVGQLEGHVDPAKVQVVHPGVELNGFDGAEDAGARWRADHGHQNKLIVLTVARLDPRKNQPMMLRAVAELTARHPNLLYVIAGQGKLESELKSQVRELGLGQHVLFTGEVDGATKLALYGACDVFAMPAIQYGTDVEGFGMVFVEAGACGKPCVAGQVGGQPEAVGHQESGLVVDGTDLSQVADSLNRLLADPALRQRMGQAGRRRAESLDWPRVVQRTVELVENVG